MLLMCALSCGQKTENNSQVKSELIYTYKIIPAFNNTFGYDIYLKNELIKGSTDFSNSTSLPS